MEELRAQLKSANESLLEARQAAMNRNAAEVEKAWKDSVIFTNRSERRQGSHRNPKRLLRAGAGLPTPPLRDRRSPFRAVASVPHAAYHSGNTSSPVIYLVLQK